MLLKRKSSKIFASSKRKPEYRPWALEDGVTQGFLEKFMCCPQKCRMSMVDGWTKDKTSDALIFGDLVHGVFDKLYTEFRDHPKGFDPVLQVALFLGESDRNWRNSHNRATAIQVQQWEECMLSAEVLLPLYCQHWRKDFSDVEWVSLEEKFDVPFPIKTYEGPRSIRIRGKLDGNMRIRKKLWLFETKTKSQVDDNTIIDCLPIDLQVNTYSWADREMYGELPHGVKYNVLRRPLLRMGKKETYPEFRKRMHNDIVSRPDWYFNRYELQLDVDEHDATVRNTHNILLDVYDWARWGRGHQYYNPSYCSGKYGTCEYLGICSRNDCAGLVKKTCAYPELDSED